MNKLIEYPTIKWPHTGAIFCGGHSSRMGCHKAGLILSDGLTMVEHVYNALSKVCREIVFVGHCQGVPESLRHITQINDNLLDRGPLGGLEALLSSGLDSEYLISPCDIGSVNRKVFELLIDDWVIPPAILTHLEYGSAKENGEASVHLIDQPLIGRYSASLLPLVQKQISRNELAMHHLISLSAATRVMVPEYLLKATKDADTMDDLSKLFNLN
ncbi:MAG: molybdenum cofactor guanylyltransferase [Candidatus Omnitrophota bacterium]